MSASPIPIPVGRAPGTASIEAYEQQPPDLDPAEDWGAFVRRTCDRFGNEDTDIDWQEYQRRVVNEHFLRGKQFRAFVSKFDGSVKIVEPKGRGAARYPHNWIRPMMRTVISQWLSASTDYNVIPIPENNATDHVSGAARYAESALNTLSDLMMTPQFEITQCLEGALSGNVLALSYWDAKAGLSIGGHTYRPTVRRPLLEMQSQNEPGAYACQQCGNGGDYEEANKWGMCPACGSENLMVQEPMSVEMPVVTGYEDVPIGWIVCHLVPRHQLKWDRYARTFQQSIYLRWRQRLRNEVIREAFPWWRKGHGSVADDAGTRADQELQRSAGNTLSGYRQDGGSKTDPETTIVDQWWWAPCVYQDRKLQREYRYGDPKNPQIIPAGTWARDVWPTGRYFTTIDNCEANCLDEHFCSVWAHMPLNLNPGQISGDGSVDDIISPQRLVNRLKALWLANIENVAAAGVIFRPNWINREDIPSTPFDAGPVKQGMPTDRPLRDAVAAIERPSISGDIPAFEQQMREEMQFSLAAHAPISGDPTVSQLGGDTATGAMIADRSARQQRVPETALRYQMKAQIGYQWLSLLQKNAKGDFWIPFNGKNGELEGMLFRSADIPKSFIVTHRSRSFYPKYDTDRQTDFDWAWQRVGGAEGLMLMASSAPSVLQQIEELADVKFDITGLNKVARIARYRVDLMNQKLQEFQQQSGAVIDPTILVPLVVQLPEVAPHPREPHPLFINWYNQLWLDDEIQRARTENPAKVALVDAMIAAHEQLLIVKTQVEQVQAAEAAGPSIAMQKDEEAAAMDQQRDTEERQAGREDEREATRANREEERARMTHANNMERERLRADTAVARGKGNTNA